MTDRYLVLVRHAKADRPADVADIDRPLTVRGHGDAAAAGVWLARRGLLPDLVLCSPAKRTRQTWHGIALGMAESNGTGPARGSGTPAARGPVVRYEPELYAGDAQLLLQRVRTVDEEAGTVLLIGHNPAISLLSDVLDPAGGSGDGIRTCGIAVHRSVGTWPDCGSGTASLTASHTARG